MRGLTREGVRKCLVDGRDFIDEGGQALQWCIMPQVQGHRKGVCGTATRLSFPKGVFIKREGVNMEFKIKGKLGIGHR